MEHAALAVKDSGSTGNKGTFLMLHLPELSPFSKPLVKL